MNLYKLSQDENNGWDTYDSCIVAADTPNEAAQIHPCEWIPDGAWNSDTWANKSEDVTVDLIGVAASNIETGIIISSFNAG